MFITQGFGALKTRPVTVLRRSSATRLMAIASSSSTRLSQMNFAVEALPRNWRALRWKRQGNDGGKSLPVVRMSPHSSNGIPNLPNWWTESVVMIAFDAAHKPFILRKIVGFASGFGLPFWLGVEWWC